MIDILLVDDQALLCEVLKTWLDVEEGLEVLGVAHNGQEAIEQVEKLQPDIVLMDIDMPQMDGLNATKIIGQRFPEVKVIFLSGHDDDAYLAKSLEVGAKGYLPKNTTAEELVSKIRLVYNNANLLDSDRDTQAIETIQARLEELIETYRHKFQSQIAEYKNSIENIDRIERIEQKYEQRLNEIEARLYEDRAKKLNELEYKNQSSWESIRKELIEVNDRFDRANRNLTLQFNQQLENLKQDLDSKLSVALDDWARQRAALQEWAVQRDEMRPSIEEYESKSHDKFMGIVNPIQESFGDVNKQIKGMRNIMVASGILTLVALAISIFLLISQVKSSDSILQPTPDAID